jgi:hypothetical protein
VFVRHCGDVKAAQEQIHKEQHEVAVVVITNAVVHPRTVVIHLKDTFPGDTVMVSSWRFNAAAMAAVFIRHPGAENHFFEKLWRLFSVHDGHPRAQDGDWIDTFLRRSLTKRDETR